MRTIKFRGVSMGGHFVYDLLSQKIIRHNGKICWSISELVVSPRIFEFEKPPIKPFFCPPP